MKHRFRFWAQRDGAGRWQLSPSEIQHGKKVLRLGPDATIEVFDGEGREALGTLGASGEVEVVHERVQERLRPRLVVGLRALRPRQFEELLPALVELGVDEVALFLGPGDDRRLLAEKPLERWQRIALAACKQCRRAYRVDLRVFPALADWLATGPAAGGRRYFLDPEAVVALGASMEHDGGAVALVLGSEKGLAPAEVAALGEAGFEARRLGGFVLRAVTAAVAAVAVVRAGGDGGAGGNRLE